jgi:phosphoribosyl-dephospho-CoA transferase
MTALARVAPLLSHRGYRWGPGGSVGFELATGVPTATWSSDLDLVLRRDCRLDANEAAPLLELLAEAAAPARVDVIVETPAGGVLLVDLARAPTQVLARTPDGPRLSPDPWAPTADQLHRANAGRD